jgi:isopentenyl diphosphate isomerase/L-lactate dehydrogenase-like FMN-dependent dehydrogenase
VSAVLEVLRAEIDRALALLGRPRFDDVDASAVRLSEPIVHPAPSA